MNTASPDDIDISAVWRTLRRALPKLLLASVVAALAAYAALSLITPQYTSEAQIQVVPPEREQTSADSTNESVTARLDKEAINTHVRALMSPDLAAEIIADEGLANKPEFNSALAPPSLLDRIVRAFDFAPRSAESEQDRVMKAYFDRLDVYSPEGEPLHRHPLHVAGSQARRRRSPTRSPRPIARCSPRATSPAPTRCSRRCSRRSTSSRRRSPTAEAEVERFRGQANIFKGGPNDTGLNQQQLGDLTAELTQGAGRAQRGGGARAVACATWCAPAMPRRSPTCRSRRSSRTWCSSACAWSGSSRSCRRRCCRRIRACARSAPTSHGLERQIKAEVGKVVEGVEKSAKVAALREAAVKRASTR